MMTTIRTVLGTIVGAAVLLLAPMFASAADTLVRGDEKCMGCHASVKADKVAPIALRRHGTKADGRTPGCDTCHGASDKHIASGDGSVKPDRVFRGPGAADAHQINEGCLGCHKGGKRSHWETGRHEQAGVACTSCHSVHSSTDIVQAKLTQPEVCFNCHKQQRTEVNKPSHHPIPEGKMACSDCHNPHGSVGRANMKRDSVNETCYTCHMEKRGPFVHNHEPVNEDCTNCHNPHGTTAESMLKARAPFLCHQCHTPHGGQAVQIAGQGQTQGFAGAAAQQTPTSSGKSGINYFMARGCVNCHTQVHGSNNPSATNPTPQFMLR